MYPPNSSVGRILVCHVIVHRFDCSPRYFSLCWEKNQLYYSNFHENLSSWKEHFLSLWSDYMVYKSFSVKTTLSLCKCDNYSSDDWNLSCSSQSSPINKSDFCWSGLCLDALARQVKISIFDSYLLDFFCSHEKNLNYATRIFEKLDLLYYRIIDFNCLQPPSFQQKKVVIHVNNSAYKNKERSLCVSVSVCVLAWCPEKTTACKPRRFGRMLSLFVYNYVLEGNFKIFG